ncbi:MAG: beta-L-arabinofuranosidase domain-containing protein [Chthoniobacterales bacterium]
MISHSFKYLAFSMVTTCSAFASTILDAVPVKLQAEPFPLSRIRLLDGPFKERQDLDARYLLDVVEPDRLLSGFRAQAGLPEKAKRYGGWEARGINGHSLGHYLTAVSALYASTGDPRALERVRYVVSELADCQQANGDGYVLPVAKKIYEDLRAGKIQATAFSLNGEWVPNYTLHKVLAGLRDAYRFAGSTQALDIEHRLADYLAGVYAKLTPAQAQQTLQSEHGGMNEVFADLSADTGDPRYLKLAETTFNQDAVLSPLEHGRDELDGKHANTQIPKIIGLAREYQLTGDETDLAGANTFWRSVVGQRSFANGSHGEGEHFFPPAQFPQKLKPHTGETCGSYNMIKLGGLLFSVEPKADQMDFVERALLNHILANLGRQPGEFGYFLGLESVGVKVFSTPDDSWWCCVGTGIENPARYGEQVYFHRPDTLWVNLYMASTLDWRERGVTLRQETKFPEGDTVSFTIAAAQPARFTLKLRHPYWCAQPEVTVNGQPVAVTSSPSSYLTLDRTWKTGDRIQLRLPMTLRTEPLPNSGGKTVALLYGPLVLAGVVPTPSGAPDPAKQRFSDHLKGRGLTDQPPPVLVAADTADLLAHLRPDGNTFASFRSDGVVKSSDLAFVPLYLIYEEHYAVYFPLLTPADWTAREASIRAEDEQRARLAAATLDTVEPGFQQSEVEHKFASDRSETGDFRNRKWRDALPGGWFSYEMAVDPAKPIALVATYWSDDRGREFDIEIDGRRLVTAKPSYNKALSFYEATYAIPPELTRGKTTVTVRLVATHGRIGTFGFRTMLAASLNPQDH